MKAGQATQPVSRGVFFCNGPSDVDFYVEINDGYERRSHPCANPTTLSHFLNIFPPPGTTLPSTKKGETSKKQLQSQTHKDEADHFYCAQLYHYGLKPLKTKAAAKKALLAKLTEEGSLQVPWQIVKLKQEMREEWKQANDKLVSKITGKKGGRPTKGKDTPTQPLYENMASASKCITPATTSSKKRKDAPGINGPEVKRLKAKPPSKSSRNTAAMKVEVMNPQPPPPVLPGTTQKQTARKSAKHYRPTKREARKAAAQNEGSGSMKKVLSDGYKMYRQYDVFSDSFDPYSDDDGDEYDDDEDPQLTLCPSSTGRHLWASFNFGAISGIMRSSSRVVEQTGKTCRFLWRGEESGDEGQMRYGPRNIATITFLGGGQVEGTFTGSILGDVKFTGTVDEDILSDPGCFDEVKEWKEEWRGINARAYEAANKRRWGNWVDTTGCQERPAASDTD